MKLFFLGLGLAAASAHATSYFTYTYRGEEQYLTYNIQILTELVESESSEPHEVPRQMRAYIRGAIDSKVYEALFCVDEDDFQSVRKDPKIGEVYNLLKIPDEPAYGWAATLKGAVHVGVPPEQTQTVPYPNVTFGLRQNGPRYQLVSPTQLQPTTGRTRSQGVANQFSNCLSRLRVL